MTDEIFQNPLFQDAEVNEAFTDFLAMRKKIRKPATDRAIRSLLKTLLALSGGNKEKAIAIIDKAVVKCWLDFYPLQDQAFGHSPQQGKKLREI